jgi:hypothetical protein
MSAVDPTLFSILLALAGCVTLLAFVVRRWRGGRAVESEAWPLFAKKPLGPAEQELYRRLAKALPEHFILAQVRLSQLLGVKKGNDFQFWQDRFSRLGADFVVCDREGAVIAVIELSDATPHAAARKSSEAETHKALAAAHIRLLRWQAWNLPNESEMRREVLGETRKAGSPDESYAPLIAQR